MQTTPESRFITGELGVKGDRYYILDRFQQLFFCFDTTGKFKYVLDNKPKGNKKKSDPHFRSILNPYSYYYQKKWYYYLTFRNVVYNKDEKGTQNIAYSWDFGKYNDNKEMIVRFPPLSPQILVPLQQNWLKNNSAFALTNARQTEKYIYTLVERIRPDTLLPAEQRFYHLLCHKPTRRCYYFNTFLDGTSLSTQLRLENQYILMLLSPGEKDKYVDLDILDEKSRRILRGLKNTDNPVVLKWWMNE